MQFTKHYYAFPLFTFACRKVKKLLIFSVFVLGCSELHESRTSEMDKGLASYDWTYYSHRKDSGAIWTYK